MKPIIKLLKSIPFALKTYHFLNDFLSTHFPFFMRMRIAKLIKQNNSEEYDPSKKLIFIMTEANDRMDWFFEAETPEGFQLLKLPREIFIFKWKTFLKNYKSHPFKFDLENYMSERWIADRNRYKENTTKQLKIIKKLYLPATILFPKFNTNWMMDIIECMNRLNMKVSIDDRESGLHPKAMEVFPQMLQNYFDHKISYLNTHNENHRQFFIDSGVPSEVIRVKGCPQSDFWFNKKKWMPMQKIHPKLNKNRFRIYFLSFGVRAYVHFYFRDEKRDWIELINDQHEILGEILTHFGNEVQIIYKLGKKKQRDLNPQFHEFKEKYAKFITDDNFLELDAAYSSYQLATISDLTIGFQTSGLYEAMFLNKPIVYGAWGELFEDIKDQILPFHQTRGLDHCKNKEEFRETIFKYIKNKDNPISEEMRSERKRFISLFMKDANGNTSQRILDDLVTTL